MNKIIKLAVLALSVFILNACGGGSSHDRFDDEPIAPYTSFGSSQNQGRTVSTAAGADGDILVFIDELNEINLVLAAGRASMNIADVQRSETYSFSCPDGTNAQVSFFENYATGVEEVSASINGQIINCTSTYPTSLFPSVIESPSSISDLLVLWNVSDAGEYITSNCPSEESVNNPFNLDIDPDPSQCETSFFMDATVTDDDGITHLVSSERLSIPD